MSEFEFTYAIPEGKEYRDMNDAEKAEQAALADRFCDALREMCRKPGTIENFQGYLEHHFFAWYQKYARDPYGLTEEAENFSKIEN